MNTPYKVLLVDDEPLVLSSLKMMAEWPLYNCELVGTARNGRDAFQCIEQLHPDIVISDINMPVMDGIALLRQTSEKYPHIAFILLTNIQEFEYARKSVHYQAVDYLIKIELEPEMLAKSLERAIEVVDQRRSQYKIKTSGNLRTDNKEHILRDNIIKIISGNTPSKSDLVYLREQGILNGFFFLEIQVLYPDHIVQERSRELTQLFMWESEVSLEVMKNTFSHFIHVPHEIVRQGILFFVFNEHEAIEEKIRGFQKKLSAASKNITGVIPCLLQTDLLSGDEGLRVCLPQIQALRNYFYLSAAEHLTYRELPPLRYSSIKISGIGSEILLELRTKNIAGCQDIIGNAIKQMENTEHEKSQGLWLSSEIYNAVYQGIQINDVHVQESSLFADSALGHQYIEFLVTRKDIVSFLASIKKEIDIIFEDTAKSADIIEMAKQYVYDHAEKRITLQEVAQKVCVSPGYLSALFKKKCNENFVSFINHTKVQRACKLIKQDKYSMNEISLMLSFENAYYFSRVFRRYVGITPSEYRNIARQGGQLPSVMTNDTDV